MRNEQNDKKYNMKLSSSSDELERFCSEAAKFAKYIAIDTEFVRQNTYYAKVCLIQIAFKTLDRKKILLIDPLEQGVNLDPLKKLLKNKNMLKIMHAGRQDLEIFLNLFDFLPTPVFDTQIAAMVCGMGEQEGYESLVRNLLGQQVNKECQFTNWSKRPLSNEQIKYATEDVTFLCDVYEVLKNKLQVLGRSDWVTEELEKLTNPKNYDITLANSLKKIKGVNGSTNFKLSVAELVNFRELIAQELNLPRNHVIKDSTLLKLARQLPQTIDSLRELDIFSYKIDPDIYLEKIVGICRNLRLKEDKSASLSDNFRQEENILGMIGLLKSLLKIKSSELNLPPKLIASIKDLEMIACQDEPDVTALKGWRKAVFGLDALKLKKGEIAITICKNQIVKIDSKVN